MNFEYVILNDKDKLAAFKGQILTLFEKCFDKELPLQIWDWAYYGNPAGSAIVSLCFFERELIGHYAVIPVSYRKGNEKIKACLSMTTMVDVAYRKYGIFVKQAQQVYEAAGACGMKFVVGFPNVKSISGFKKRLNWQIDKEDYVAVVTKKQLCQSSSLKNCVNSENLVMLDVTDNAFLKWRLTKPGLSYIDRQGVIIKDYDISKDIVFLNHRYEEVLNDNEIYNVLIDGSIDDFWEYKAFDYPFGYRILDENFKKDLLMSDVF